MTNVQARPYVNCWGGENTSVIREWFAYGLTYAIYFKENANAGLKALPNEN